MPHAGLGSRVILFPAIDILGGRAVRLTQGDYDRSQAYEDDPLEAARRWVDQGASRLHVVDLDGARDGRPVNVTHVERIVGETGVPVQVGGGLRSAEAVDTVLAAGAARAIIGTAAYRDADLLGQVLDAHAERIAVAVDVKAGRVATSGWLASTDLSAQDAIAGLADRGVQRFVYTDVDRDGMLEGPDMDGVRAVSEAVGERTFVYSGGVGALEHLQALAALDLPNLEGVIVGKALYEGRFDVVEALAALA